MSSPRFKEVLLQSFLVVGVAEAFDKTWFVGVLCSLLHGAQVTFLGSFLALALHTIIAACLGAVVAKFIVAWVLNLVTAVVFSILAIFYTYEAYHADPNEDALTSRKADAAECLDEQADLKKPAGGGSLPHSTRDWKGFAAVFTAVFIAEWGDRTQVAMMTLHASLPTLPVCLGSLLAFFLLCLSAVLVARLLEGQKLSERLISSVSAISFLVFAVLAFASTVSEFGAR